MRADERIVRAAAAILPLAIRDIRREEWLADLDGAETIGVSRRDVAFGALTYAVSHNRLRARMRLMSPRAWLLAGLAAAGVIVVGAPGLAIATYAIGDARGIVTVETAADGSERTVHWRDHPGSADIDPRDALAGPSLEEGLAAGEEMVAEIRHGLTAELGLEWVEPPAGQRLEDSVQRTENGYGGWSMLAVVNAPTAQSTTVPATWEGKQRAMRVIGEVAARYGFSAPRLDQEHGDPTRGELIRDLGGATPDTQVFVSGMLHGPTGQWLSFAFQDLSKDVDGRFADEFEAAREHGWEPNSLSLMYGANGLLAEEDRAEFIERLAPYAGLARPEPQLS